MTFYLGTHEPSWLARTDVPLFISRRRLTSRSRLPVALGPWALDSGGFTELNLHGRWETTAAQYAAEAERFAAEVGQLAWAAPQDWMCESFVLGKTGRTVREHQDLTTASYLELRALAPGVPWAPVLQGWSIDDYLGHADQYHAAGIDLSAATIVGVGSVCRRQGTREIADLLAILAAKGLRLHGFGLKLAGLARSADSLASADSMAWSFRARRSPPLPGCTHRSCANCQRYALRWRSRIEHVLARPRQAALFT